MMLNSNHRARPAAGWGFGERDAQVTSDRHQKGGPMNGAARDASSLQRMSGGTQLPTRVAATGTGPSVCAVAVPRGRLA